MCQECSPSGPTTEDEAGQIECPSCGHAHEDADYFERGVGSEEECQECGAIMVLVSEEQVWRYTWQARPK